MPACSCRPGLVHGDLELDSARRLVTRGGHLISLSPKEFAVLELLLGAQGAVVSTEQILERAWDDATDPFTNTMRMTVSRLRAKLGDPPAVETVSPIGYRIGGPGARRRRRADAGARRTSRWAGTAAAGRGGRARTAHRRR